MGLVVRVLQAELRAQEGVFLRLAPVGYQRHLPVARGGVDAVQELEVALPESAQRDAREHARPGRVLDGPRPTPLARRQRQLLDG